MGNAYWIWYPGDFEIYQGLLQNFSREERGFDWPAYWYQDDCLKNVKFSRTYELEQETTFTVHSKAQGYLRLNDVKHRYGETVTAGPGTARIEVWAGRVSGLPSIYVEGETIRSDASWEVCDLTGAPSVPVGLSERYTSADQDPSVWEYDCETVLPIEEKCAVAADGFTKGILYNFGRELTAELDAVFPQGFRPVQLCFGESVSEAEDPENCYYSQTLSSAEEPIRRRAFRYVFIPGVREGEVRLTARHLYVDLPVKAAFTGSDPLINRIWAACAETFQLCSGIFFLDGVKRDRWIWSGDAYQSYLVNAYLFFDEEISKRTMWALRGRDPVRLHINTIVDYSMYWIISIRNHYEMTGDLDFVRAIMPRIRTMMEFLEGQLDEHGFLIGRKGDWIFIDWTEMDKDGPLCAEQMLLAKCYETMAEFGRLLREDGCGKACCAGNADTAETCCAGNTDSVEACCDGNAESVEGCCDGNTEACCDGNAEGGQEPVPEDAGVSGSAGCSGNTAGTAYRDYEEKCAALLQKIEQYYWCPEKHAYIDSFTSGKQFVTRHANLFAVLFGYAEEGRKREILEHVIENDAIPQITTPYFKFYELEALACLGRRDEVTRRMKEYWGAILAESGDEPNPTIWEEYVPGMTGNERYAMYGDPFGKSLCHAWGASPIYLIGKYYAGVKSTAPGYRSFVVEPDPDAFKFFSAAVPVKDGCVHIDWDGKQFRVLADRDGGVLKAGGQTFILEKGVEKTVRIRE